MRGVFVWQRKKKADEWENITGESLNKLKAGEGYRLEPKSDEVAALLQEIQDGRRSTRSTALSSVSAIPRGGGPAGGRSADAR